MKPVLPQFDSDPRGRSDALDRARDELVYAWDRPDGVATSERIPRRLGYSATVIAQVSLAGGALAANRTAARLHRPPAGDAQPSGPTDTTSLFATIAPPPVHAALGADADDEQKPLWDRAFAWQRVAGANPHVLERLPSIEPLRSLAPLDGEPLARACAEGRAYIADYRGYLRDVRGGEGKSIAAPCALFVRPAGARSLVSVAILREREGASTLVLPNDRAAWALARREVQCADANVQESYFHLGRGHFVAQAFAMATERQLSARHPLFVLLAAHTRGTLAINQSARDELIVAGGQLDQLMAPRLDDSLAMVSRAVREWDPAQHGLRADLARRGLDDRDALPEHPFRDDALLVQSAIERWCLEYVCVAYGSESELQSDLELRAWLDELRSTDGGRLRALPERVESRVALAELLATVLYVTSLFHASVNYSQFDFMGWMNNAPAQLAPGSAWPSVARADEQLTFMYQQSQVRDDRLGEYGEGYFADTRIQASLARFRAALSEASSSIRAQQSQRWIAYPYLDPALLTASIHI